MQDNVYRISAEHYGTSDIVLFLGLLYHMPDPLEALRIVRSVCRGARTAPIWAIYLASLSCWFSTTRA